ncbi:MAG: class I SAM-dependent methyltransferase [Patescibacteria group bacterium]|jgi:SAM-dependent methyltransferase
MPNVAHRIRNNQRAWDRVADLFLEATALPAWAVFGVGKDLGLIPTIKGKSFLEIGCGSGRSIAYLARHGAKKIYAIDASPTQIREAAKFNHVAHQRETVKLFTGPMEKKYPIPPVDIVFSIYGLGWTQRPEITLRHIYRYLKPGGRFIWSWDHALFFDVGYEKDKFVVQHSYHDERVLHRKDWKRPGVNIFITYRKTETWFRLLTEAGFNIIEYHEPKPKNTDRAHRDPKKYYSLQKAKLIPASFIFVCQKPIKS